MQKWLKLLLFREEIHVTELSRLFKSKYYTRPLYNSNSQDFLLFISRNRVDKTRVIRRVCDN